MTIINKDTIRNNEQFVLKWSKAPGEAGAWNPGWKQQTDVEEFLTRLSESPSILNDARFINMEAKEKDISYLRVKARLQSMTELSGPNKGAQIDDINKLEETVPEFFRTKLVAEPFTAYTWTPKTFLLENIEKESFLPNMEARLAESAGYSAETIGMYGRREPNPADADGIHFIDGVFAQCEKIKSLYQKKKDPRGYFDDIDASKEIIPQLKKLITAFTLQKGNRKDAVLYVSTELEGMILEEADKRETEAGDKIYFDGEHVFIWGTQVRQADFLDVPENDFGEQVLLADPNSIVFGFLEDFTAENTYEHPQKAYLSSFDVYFDVLILWNRDVLAAKVVNMPSGNTTTTETRTVSVSVKNSSETGINNASVKLTNSEGSYTGTTGSAGGCSINNVPEGEYNVEVTASGYTKYSGTFTVSESSTELNVEMESA